MTAVDEHTLPSPWGTHAIPSSETLRLELGPLVVWALARTDEIWLAHAPGDGGRGAEAPPREPPADEEWTRWPVPSGTDRIALSPIFPPRPIVAEPELAFRLLPGAVARIFVRVPLWARVTVVTDEEALLTELPTIVLSDTWWGSFTEGELCYWLATTARRRVEVSSFAPHLAVCPLHLSNESGQELQVEEIALRVAHLSVFGDAGHLWADETRVVYRGEDEGSDIDVSGRPPPEAPNAVRVATPRSPLPRGFRARTFARLRALSGLAGL